jgi:methylene-fatty-acyl-phospholipid synthase
MTWWLFLVAAPSLGIERIAYALIWRDPERLQAWCATSPVRRLRNPVRVVRDLFLVCKLIQGVTFAAWIYLHNAGSWWPPGGWVPITIGTAAIVTGQVLNLGVFLRLGTTGVFYGSRFGYDVRWCRGFPFSIVSHPQYVGTVLSIWGLFLITRFPHPDWYLLPALETAYYALGARFEEEEAPAGARRLSARPPPSASAPSSQGIAPESRLTLT